MTLAWVAQQRTKNSGWIDAVWTLAVGTIGVAGALWPISGLDEISNRQLLVAALIAIWAARLGIFIIQRSASKPDDPRYAKLVEDWGPDARWQMFVLLQKQALVSIPLVISIFLAAHNPTPLLGWADALAVGLFFMSWGGEALADRQLKQFISDERKDSPVCKRGLWRYSRHPNYFFEWLHWLVYPMLAISLDGGYVWGWLALSAPLMMYWLLNYISGIPPLEEHMVRKHGDAYRGYQKETNAFFPGPVRATHQS